MKKKLVIICFLIILVSAFFLAHSINAAGLTSPLKGSIENAGTAGKAIAVMIGLVIEAVLGIVGAIALVLFVYGGMMMIISGGSSEKINKGKEILIWATIGLFIILGSGMLVNFVIGVVNPAASTGQQGAPPQGSPPPGATIQCDMNGACTGQPAAQQGFTSHAACYTNTAELVSSNPSLEIGLLAAKQNTNCETSSKMCFCFNSRPKQ